MKKIVFIVLFALLAPKGFAQNLNDHYNNAIIGWQLGNHAAAVDEFTKAIKEHPKNDTLYNLRGICEFELNDYPNAVKDFDMAIKLNPKYSQAYYMRGFCEEIQMCLDYKKAKQLGDTTKFLLEKINKFCK